MSLATKYRPLDFTDVVGQEVVTETLQAELEQNKVKHAYIFMGKTGAGKTTISRILANKLDSHIIEIDVASNNSAEAMRNLIQDVKNKPILHKYTVVILDEAHSASNQAMQALLKVLEQPPKHLIFILCTTEGNKLPTTIYNRCEVFEFTPVSEELIQKRLRQVCELEHIEATETALSVIATLADGSVRQAIANLEQCTSAPKVTTQVVRQYLLADSYDGYLNTLYYVLDKQLDLLMEKINQISNVEKFVNDLIFLFIVPGVATRVCCASSKITAAYSDIIKSAGSGDRITHQRLNLDVHNF